MLNGELLGAVDALYNVNDKLGVELMGATNWNGLKKAVTQYSCKALQNPKCIVARSGYAYNDPITKELFGFNDLMGNELLGGWWTDLKNGVANATHSVLNAGSKVPYISDAVSDVRSIANIFKKGNSANNSANAAIDNIGEWIKANKVKVALGVGGAALILALLLRRKGKRR